METTRRSLIYVPGDSEKMLLRSLQMPADVLMLNLEDGVAASQKDVARRNVPEALNQPDPAVIIPGPLIREIQGPVTPDLLAQTVTDLHQEHVQYPHHPDQAAAVRVAGHQAVEVQVVSDN